MDGQPVNKAGFSVSNESKVVVTAEEPKYVCRGGHKLEAALEAWGLDVAALTALDAGLSTGGFTDCLLQRGCARVYGVDVGYGQVHERIRTHPRVVLMERCNLRHLQLGPLPAGLPERVHLVTLDLSFISVLKVLPAVKELLLPGGRVAVLVKPQFEALRGEVGRGGVVKDERVHADVLRRVRAGALEMGFLLGGSLVSPLRGAKEGNIEFLELFTLPEDVTCTTSPVSASEAV